MPGRLWHAMQNDGQEGGPATLPVLRVRRRKTPRRPIRVTMSARLWARVSIAAVVSLLSACSPSNIHYSALEPYPSVDELVAEHGQPDEDLVWSRDHWTGSVCDASTARVIVFHDLRGPLGRLIHRLIGGVDTVVCVSREGSVSLVQDLIN